MCLAIPGTLVAIDGLRGTVDILGVRRETRLDLIDSPSLGDRLLMHAGFAIERIDAERAAEIESAVRDAFLSDEVEANEE